MIIKNARIVLPDEVIKGSIFINEGQITELQHGDTQVAEAIDWNGDYLIPGLVELHTDNMEKYFSPRPSVTWPRHSAIMAHDVQMAGSGITTVFDAVAVGYEIFKSDRAKILDDIIESINHFSDEKLFKADHFIHLRCELSCEETSNEFDQYSDNSLLRLVSLMDHAPGQRQFARIEKYKEYYQKKYHYSDVEMGDFIDKHQEASKEWASKHREYIANICLAQNIPMASHDDATKAHVDEAIGYKVNIAEFPTTLEAAKLSHENDLQVLMGAPNLIRGGSHSGNVAASDLADNKYLDIISSDYYPGSMLESAFVLANMDNDYSLSDAVNCITFNPAKAVGLDDRGSISLGKKADLIRVTDKKEFPQIKEVWKEGARVS